MRAWLAVLMVALAGCTVQVVGAECDDDLHCPSKQRCGPQGRCVEGARAADTLGEDCRTAVATLARHADECIRGASGSSLQLVDAETVCDAVTASVRGGRLAYAPEELGACVRAFRTMPCEELTLEDFTRGGLLARCGAFRPLTAEGGACGGTLDCQGGWCDARASCPGVCRRYVPAGASCDGSVPCQPGSGCSFGVCRADARLGEPCNFGVRCDPAARLACGADNRCLTRATSGPCQTADQCAPGHACVKVSADAGAGSARECRPARTQGESCMPGLGECGGLLFCDAATSSCLPWPQSGQTCGDVEGTGTELGCLGSRCAFGPFFTRLCQPYIALGQACSQDLECGPVAACRNRVCVATWCP
ncbi:hypothetical protein [Archangium sp.]|uniref:hypothetical protein n=1 Tax=Archangium sp. TaxID=1872627 RepID=UPI00286AA434|nr:hypothetical protein [Archangium sp.]